MRAVFRRIAIYGGVGKFTAWGLEVISANPQALIMSYLGASNDDPRSSSNPGPWYEHSRILDVWTTANELDLSLAIGSFGVAGREDRGESFLGGVIHGTRNIRKAGSNAVTPHT